jgi:hypothetical protein
MSKSVDTRFPLSYCVRLSMVSGLSFSRSLSVSFRVFRGSLLRSLFVSFVYFVVSSFSLSQTVPQLINYQGRLCSTNGAPLATGEYDLTVSLFESETATTSLWEEQHVSVPIVRGHFNVVLGGLNTNGLAAALVGGNRHVVVAASGGGTSGRQRLLSVPYAMQSGNGCPVGTILAWHKNITASNSLALPYGWVECNGKVVSNYPGSVLQGEHVPNLNLTDLGDGDDLDGYAGGAFLRGSTASGQFQEATAHVNVFANDHVAQIYAGGYYGAGNGGPHKDKALSHGNIGEWSGGHNWTPGAGKPTTFASRPVNMSVVWIIRVE